MNCRAGRYRLDWLRYKSAAIAGAAYGLALYAVNYYLIAPLAFPWFTEMRGGLAVLTHLVFGMVLGAGVVRLHTIATRAVNPPV